MPGGVVSGVLAIGLVGKLPAHGDFIRRGRDPALIARFDRWLENALSRADPAGLAERLEAMPSWRFALAEDGSTLLGATVASRDAIGRPFPLLGVARVADRPGRQAADDWCARAEQVLATARDAGQDAGAALAALDAIGWEAPAGDEPVAPGWWRDGERIAGDTLPVGDAFDRLFGFPAAEERR